MGSKCVAAAVIGLCVLTAQLWQPKAPRQQRAPSRSLDRHAEMPESGHRRTDRSASCQAWTNEPAAAGGCAR